MANPSPNQNPNQGEQDGHAEQNPEIKPEAKEKKQEHASAGSSHTQTPHPNQGEQDGHAEQNPEMKPEAKEKKQKHASAGSSHTQTPPRARQHVVLPPIPSDNAYAGWNVMIDNPRTNGTPGAVFDEAATAAALRHQFPEVKISQLVLEAMKRETLKGYMGKESHPLESGGFIFTNHTSDSPKPDAHLQIFYATGPGISPSVSSASVFIDEAFIGKFSFLSERPLQWENTGAWHSHHVYASVRRSFGLLYPSGGDVETANNALKPASKGGYDRSFFLMPLAHIWPNEQVVRIRLYVFFRDKSDASWTRSRATWYPLILVESKPATTASYLIATQFEYEALGKLPKQWYVANQDARNFTLALLASVPKTLKDNASTLEIQRLKNTNLAFHVKANNGTILDYEFLPTFPAKRALIELGGTSSKSKFQGPIGVKSAAKIGEEAAALLHE
jgi:hypothetical protein